MLADCVFIKSEYSILCMLSKVGKDQFAIDAVYFFGVDLSVTHAHISVQISARTHAMATSHLKTKETAINRELKS